MAIFQGGDVQLVKPGDELYFGKMETKSNWRLIDSEAVSIPVYWPGQDKKESDVGMKSKYECRFCGFRKSWWHKKGITPDLYKFCPDCGKKMITEADDD